MGIFEDYKNIAEISEIVDQATKKFKAVIEKQFEHEIDMLKIREKRCEEIKKKNKNLFEIEYLKKAVEKGYKYITRDKNGKVLLHSRYPKKYCEFGNAWMSDHIPLSSWVDYDSVKWEDENPTKIEDLIKELENEQG